MKASQCRKSPLIEVVLEVTDLSGYGNVDLNGEVQSHIELASGEQFNLNAGPLFRGRLLKIAVDEFVLVLTMHHIISDGWSIGVLVRELAALYEA